jgi:hypothetical protein
MRIHRKDIRALESVGAYLTIDGWTYPMLANGSMDESAVVHLDDIAEEDWWQRLSDGDQRIVGAVKTWRGQKATSPHTDLDTIDLDHDRGLRGLTSVFGEEEL